MTDNPFWPNRKEPPETEGEDARTLKALDIVAFNRASERRFIQLVAELIQNQGPTAVQEIIQETAFELDISTETAKRYLIKHTARRAKFAVHDGFVSIRKLSKKGKP